MAVSWLEALSSLLGLAYVWLAARERVAAWPVSIAGSLLALYVYFASQLYYETGLYAFYILISLYGWQHWRRRAAQPQGRPILRMPLPRLALLLAACLLLSLLLGAAADRWSSADLPYWDAAIAVFSLAGTWMQARKYLENWPLWIAVDSLAAGVYIYKGLYFFAVLFAVYTLMAWWGWKSWQLQAGA
jgi:nicotinamide mononucleotide transporter